MSTEGTRDEPESSFCRGRLEKWRKISEGGEFCGKFKAEEGSGLTRGWRRRMSGIAGGRQRRMDQTGVEVRTMSHETSESIRVAYMRLCFIYK